MFVRVIKRKTTCNRTVQIVETFRKGDKVVQRIVRHMGSVPEGPSLEGLKQQAEQELQRIKENRQPSLFPSETLADLAAEARRAPVPECPIPIADVLKLEEKKRLMLGYHEVFGHLYQQLGLEKLWPVRQKASARVFRHAVLMHLAAPERSKRTYARGLSMDHGAEVPVEKFYRMMDCLDEQRIKRLKACLEREVAGLLRESVEMLFFDVTTLSFASDREDQLRRKGWSKDGKPHRVQVVLALVQTRDGLPMDYRLFPGNTADVETLRPMLEELRGRFELERAVVVADAGLESKANLEALSSAGFDWVVAARLRQRLARGIKESGRRGRYLKIEKGALSLDQEAIEKAACFDGLHGVWTSLEKVPPSEVRRHYAGLRQIEHGFRVLKHTLAVRPVFHWTEHRVRAHVAICYAAFALLRILRFKHRVFNQGKPLSEAHILSELSKVEASLLHDPNGDRYFLLPSQTTRTQQQLYTTVGCPLVKRTAPVSKECAKKL